MFARASFSGERRRVGSGIVVMVAQEGRFDKVEYAKRYRAFKVKAEEEKGRISSADATSDSKDGMENVSYVTLFEGRKECMSDFDCSACLADPSAECAATFGYVRKVVYGGSDLTNGDDKTSSSLLA